MLFNKGHIRIRYQEPMILLIAAAHMLKALHFEMSALDFEVVDIQYFTFTYQTDHEI